MKKILIYLILINLLCTVNLFADRYPILFEYNMIDVCINADEILLKKSNKIKKITICACALKLTENELSYSEYMKNIKLFTDIFAKNTDRCLSNKKLYSLVWHR